MQSSRPQGRLTRFVRARWPLYLFGYLGAILFFVLFIWVSILQGWYAFVLLSLLVLSFICLVLIASLRSADKVYDRSAVGRSILAMVPIQPHWAIVDINMGSLELAEWMSRQLSTGKVISIDIYNPQLAPSRTLARNRQFEFKPVDDPRLSIRQGTTGLLPLPDSCVPLVTLIQSLSELWQDGDKIQLLLEIHRILEPGGQLLIAERMANKTNLLTSGPAIAKLKTVSYWQRKLEQAGFQFHRSGYNDAPLTLLLLEKPSVVPQVP
jgi:ubiquinone/menaquinone biosynthesis C-methylase UbiE